MTDKQEMKIVPEHTEKLITKTGDEVTEYEAVLLKCSKSVSAEEVTHFNFGLNIMALVESVREKLEDAANGHNPIAGCEPRITIKVYGEQKVFVAPPTAEAEAG